MMPQRLPGHQEVVGPDRSAGGFEDGAHGSCDVCVGVFEWKDQYRPRQKSLQPLAIEFLLHTLRNAIPEFEHGYGRHRNWAPAALTF